jgi:toxin ParE1/3/4
MKRLDVSQAASDDLREIAGYTERTWGPAQKRRYMAEIQTLFARLRNGTGIGRQRDDIGPGYRSANVGRHIVFYKETEEAFVIVRILHERMDLHRRLAEK